MSPDRLYFSTRCYAPTRAEARAKIRTVLAKQGLRAVGEIWPRSDVAPQWCAGLGVTWWEVVVEVMPDAGIDGR